MAALASNADQDVSSYSGGQHESTVPALCCAAPSTPWSCSPVLPAQPPLQGHPQTKLHTQGCSGDQSQQANQTHSKTHPREVTDSSSVQAHVENLIENSLKGQQCTYKSTFLPSFHSFVPPPSDLNASTCRSDRARRLKPHQEVKSQVWFNRGRQTNTLIADWYFRGVPWLTEVLFGYNFN